MTSWSGYLDAADLAAVTGAITDAGLATHEKLNALMLSLPPRYAGLLDMHLVPPIMRLRAQLRQMNRVHNLKTGEVPLALFLTSAIDATADSSVLEVLEKALAKIKRHEPATASAAMAGKAVPGPVRPTLGANLEVTPEVQIGDFDQTLLVDFLSRGVEAARSVFKIVVHRHFEGKPNYITADQPDLSNGTGWVIAPGLAITNHHVISARARADGDATPDDFRLQAERSKVLFDYFRDDPAAEGVELGSGALLASDPQLDFALLRLPAALQTRRPMRLRKNRIAKTLVQALGMGVNVLQHPDGKPMRLGFRNNFVVVGDESVLAYLTDTASGSSGSPVCDDAWTVAALHYGARPISDEGLHIMGKLIRRENVGTPVPTILQHLAQRHPDLHAEIAAGQAP
jgi:endonuclease G, mitochondrial